MGDTPPILNGTHCGKLLGMPTINLSVDATFDDFEKYFSERLDPIKDPKEFTDALFDCKDEVATLYAKTLFGPMTQDKETCEPIGRYWTTFSEWSIDKTLRFVRQMPEIQKFFDKDEDVFPGLFVLGLGKLGGRDLNYSSDVDLICFFDDDLFKVKSTAGKTDVAIRAMKLLTQILGGEHGQRVWRVDWRLRPDPGATGLAMPYNVGLDYYFYSAAAWRKLAMLKARTIAGDKKTGEHFLEELTPYLWQKNLDFRAIEEVAELKKRIRNEHPDLSEQREAEPSLDVIDDFHVKLGAGGIREIEFSINGIQLVWGGKQAALRVRHTLTALNEINNNGHLEEGMADKLKEAYCILRGLENRIQIVDDKQTHKVPSDNASGRIGASQGREQLEALYGDGGFAEITKKLPEIRTLVNTYFDSTFKITQEDEEEEQKEKNQQDIDAGVIGASFNKQKEEDQKEQETQIMLTEEITSTLSPRQDGILQTWQQGFVNYGVPTTFVRSMKPLHEALIAFLQKIPDVGEALERLDDFFAKLPPGGQYLSLLAQNPQLVNDVLEPLISEGEMTNLLHHSPHVVDTLLQWRGHTNLTKEERLDYSQFIDHQKDYDTKLEAIRSYVNEMLYLAYLGAWRGERSAEDSRTLLTEIAMESLVITSNIVAEHEGYNPDTLSVIGFGKLGMGEMMPKSDLDIVFLSHGPDENTEEDIQASHKFATTLEGALTHKMEGGQVYEIDTRLRPSGKKGAASIRLNMFDDHQIHHAKTWEHLALVPAKFAVGPEFVKKGFQKERVGVLTKKRDKKQLVCDSHSMLIHLRDHRIEYPEKGILSIKLVPGGIMEAEYLMSYLVLKWAPEHPKLPKTPFRDVPNELEKIDPTLKGFGESLRIMRDVHFYERLSGWTNKPINTLPLNDHPLGMSANEMEEITTEAIACVDKLIKKEIIEASGLSDKDVRTFPDETIKWTG